MWRLFPLATSVLRLSLRIHAIANALNNDIGHYFANSDNESYNKYGESPAIFRHE